MAEQNTDKTNKRLHENPDISIVVPLLNEEDSLRELSDRIREALNEYSYEILFVDDGSDDGSWNEIEALGSGDNC
ncbi:MAG TPA: glycosyltransferase, partial [Balneolaceae bacterium]|nr:glycosyltransferase [Balneolaceae bacterium]